jgi:hypothetical protein
MKQQRSKNILRAIFKSRKKKAESRKETNAPKRSTSKRYHGHTSERFLRQRPIWNLTKVVKGHPVPMGAKQS